MFQIQQRTCGLAMAILMMIGTAVVAARPMTQRTNEDVLRDRIEYGLESSPLVKKFDIKVRVNGNDVTLSGDVATQEALAAASILRQRLPDLKLRFVNVVDLFRLQPASVHPHGSSDSELDGLFTADKPIIFNFHGYPWLIHRLAYKMTNHANLHVHGYREKGNINTPFELAILNETSRFHLVIDVIDRVPKLRSRAAHLKEEMRNLIIDNLNYAHDQGTDRTEISDWTWPD